MRTWNELVRALVATAIAGATAPLGIRVSALATTASQRTTRVERAYSRRRTRSDRLGASMARGEAEHRAGRKRAPRMPLTTLTTLRATKARRPMAAASVAKRKAVPAGSGGLGDGRA